MFNFLKKMFNFLGYIQLLVGLIKPTKEAIEAVEQPGYGEEKKEAVLNLMLEVLRTAEQVVPGMDINEEAIVSFIGEIIDVFVAFYNLTGKFTKTVGNES